MEGLADKEIVKVASHPEGRHFLALTLEGELYSWGAGDKGKLGHGDTRYPPPCHPTTSLV